MMATSGQGSASPPAITVLIAGVAGASLGTEVAKALRMAGGYYIVGCDVSALAFGHYGAICDETVLMPQEGYIDRLIAVAYDRNVRVVIPGADVTAQLIAAAAERFREAGIAVAVNSARVVATLSDKESCFAELARLGFAIPQTAGIAAPADLDAIAYPCVVKPARDSGGSAFVFFARNRAEAELYFSYLRANGKHVIAQEYVSHEHGEFTVGVLNDPSGKLIDSIALKRAFPAKLSVLAQGEDFLISSGYTQGHIGLYPEVVETARKIATAVGSTGPINVQGRVDHSGRFLPFEINPRFSASTYLRALAGFNEIDYFIRSLLGEPQNTELTIRPGWYLRSLTEAVVPEGSILA
jgi:carbamoyl-phosphate synthase large subunit